MPHAHPSIISSPHNLHFKRWISLLETPGIKRHHQCLVSGIRIGTEILKHSPETVLELLLPSDGSRPETERFSGQTYRLAKPVFGQLDIFGTHAPLLVCHIPSLPMYDLAAPPKDLELLCPMGDPGNLGSLLRGCYVFGADRVILLDESVHPFHPKVIRASSGAVFSLSLHRGGSLSELGQPDMARWVTALDMVGDDLGSWAWSKHTRLLIGEEGLGIPSVSFAHRLKIPQAQESIPLNASVAGHIALYAYRQTHPILIPRRAHP